MAVSAPNPSLTTAFRAILPDGLQPFCTRDPAEILRVPAKASEVGDIVVHNDGDEFTVAVGRIDHRHFEVYCATGATEHDRQREAAKDAVDWVQDIIAERVRFRVEFEAGRLIAGSSWHIGHHDGGRWLKRTDEVREYTCSGEKFRGGRPTG
jgi:hypothetical protein